MKGKKNDYLYESPVVRFVEKGVGHNIHEVFDSDLGFITILSTMLVKVVNVGVRSGPLRRFVFVTVKN